MSLLTQTVSKNPERPEVPGGTRGKASPAAREFAPRMGGVALRNGLVLVSERYWAAAIRTDDGSIHVASGRKPRLSRGVRQTDGLQASGTVGGVPVLRGLGRLAESILVLGEVKMKLPHAGLPLEGGRVAGALAGSVVATSAVKALAPRSALMQETGIVLASFVPAVLALKKSSILAYHGAEHKVIAGCEATQRAAGSGRGSSTRPVSAAEAAKEHDRCGSNLVGPYLLATIVTNLLARGRSGRKSPLASALAGAVSLGVSLEALRWASNHGDSILARLLLLPGRTLQKRLTTAEPTPDQLEVGERALAELLRLERASA